MAGGGFPILIPHASEGGAAAPVMHPGWVFGHEVHSCASSVPPVLR